MRLPARFAELWRFYQAALVNTAFGFGVYAMLLRLGLNLYLAQVLAQLLGMSFNYLTYSRHVFRRSASRGEAVRFFGAYGVNYLVNLTLLAVFERVVASDYVAGFIATIGASLINYLVLKHLIFASARPAA